MRRTLSAIAISLGLTGLASHARGQESVQEEEPLDLTAPDANGRGRLRVYGGVRVGVGGEEEAEIEAGGSLETDMTLTLGAQLGADYVIAQYFALGSELRLASILSRAQARSWSPYY